MQSCHLSVLKDFGRSRRNRSFGGRLRRSENGHILSGTNPV